MASREAINRIKIEKWRLSQVPIDPTETIYQGDLICFNVARQLAGKAVAASAGTFIGMAETTNPIETVGSPTFLSAMAKPYINLVQEGLVEVIIDANTTLYPWDYLTVTNTNAQTVTKTAATSSNCCGVVDPGFVGGASRAVLAGDLVKMWIKLPSTAAQYKV